MLAELCLITALTVHDGEIALIASKIEAIYLRKDRSDVIHTERKRYEITNGEEVLGQLKECSKSPL